MFSIDRYGDAAEALNGALSGDDYIGRLERKLTDFMGKSVVALSTVDGAIHTALELCGVKSGDFVFVPTVTFYSYIAAVAYSDAVPVFLDCDPNTRCVSAAALETALLWAQLQGKPPKAVVIDNAFGAVADFDILVPLCKAWNVPTIELCCDTFLYKYKDKPCGANCDFGVIGFDKRLYGGGGAIVCGDEIHAVRRFARYEYSDGGNHDYRINNFVAALDCAQVSAAKKLSERARKNLDAIANAIETTALPTHGDSAAYAFCKAANIRTELAIAGFDVKKPLPAHTLSQYSDSRYFEHEQGYSVSESFDEYCLINMDISRRQCNKLIKLLKTNCHKQ